MQNSALSRFMNRCFEVEYEKNRERFSPFYTVPIFVVLQRKTDHHSPYLDYAHGGRKHGNG
jgi:hypothetical protein